MNIEANKHDRQIATFIHISTFAKYFIPFGNFIFPVLLWVVRKKDASFVDDHGRQAINFQISILLYYVFLCLIALPFILWQVFSAAGFEYDYSDFSGFWRATTFGIIVSVLGILFLALFIVELVTVISAASHAHKGLAYHYPISIPFLRPVKPFSNHTAPASSTY